MLLLRAKGLYKQTPNCLSSVVHCIHPLWLHGLQHVRLPCPSPTSRPCSSSCLSSRWCHPTISSSVIPFSSYLQSFPPSGSFQMSQLFASGGQSIGVSASVLPMNIQDWFPLAQTGLISLLSKKLSRVFSSIIWKHRFFGTQPFFMVQLSHPYSMTTGKTIALLYEQLLAKWCLCFLIQCLGLL